MLTMKDQSKILEEVYPETLIKCIDYLHIKSLLEDFSYEKCKIALIGNDILTRDDVYLPNVFEERKEPRFSSTYRVY